MHRFRVGGGVDRDRRDPKLDLDALVPPEDQAVIRGAFTKLGLNSLSKTYEALGGRFDYGALKLVRAAMLGAEHPS
jgi:hypothetical protein